MRKWFIVGLAIAVVAACYLTPLKPANAQTSISPGGVTIPITDTNVLLQGSIDSTKGVRFEVDGITTATTRVVTVPDSDGTMAYAGAAQTFTGVQTFTNGIVLVDDSRTIADNGNGGTPATLTLTPTASTVLLTCNDAQGCTITMGESGMATGQILNIENSSTNNCTFADTSGVTELAGAFTMGQFDTLQLMYAGNRWNELGRSDN